MTKEKLLKEVNRIIRDEIKDFRLVQNLSFRISKTDTGYMKPILHVRKNSSIIHYGTDRNPMSPAVIIELKEKIIAGIEEARKDAI